MNHRDMQHTAPLPMMRDLLAQPARRSWARRIARDLTYTLLICGLGWGTVVGIIVLVGK